MRRCVTILALLAIWALTWTLPRARAQTLPTPGPVADPASTAKPPEVKSPPSAEASPLDTFLLRDSKGNLVPVLDLPFEEFERLLRIKRGLAPPAPPDYTLDSLAITGEQEGDLVHLQIGVTVRTSQTGLVRVPLGLDKAILRQPAKFAGTGEHFLTHEMAGGYVLWLRGDANEPHQVTLQVSVPALSVGGETRMQLALPQATESSLHLMVPTPHAQARLSVGEGIASAKDLEDGRSELVVLGPAGNLELAWQPGTAPAASRPAALESSGEIVVKVEGENRISSDVRLRVRSTAGNVETFRVRLPPGMELVPTDPVGYSVTLVPAGDVPPARGPQSAQIVEIVFDRSQSGIVEVRLLAERAATFVQRPLMPARFEVLGAVRQRGTIDFSVEGDWHLTWKDDASVRRLDLPTDPAAAKLAARFEFSRQPCGLQLTVASRPSRISVEPLHVVYIDDRQVRSEATLKYRLRGARAEGLSFELGDWQLDRLTPGDLFDIVPPDPAGRGPRMIPFRAGVSLPSELEVKLEAHRSIDPAGSEIAFTLPRCVGDIVAPATVMIVPADNVELTPQSARITGLALDPAPAVARFPSRQQPPLVYRDLGAGEPVSFAAEFRVRTRWSTASARAKVQLDFQQLQVEQRLDYRIAYERRRTFDLLIPRAVLAGSPLQVLFGEESLTPTPATDAPGVGDAARFQVVVPTEQIGLCQLVVKYSLPLPKWDRQKPLTLEIPLVVPADESHQQLGGQQIEFATSEPLAFKPDPGDSDEFSRPSPTSTGGQPAYAWSRVAPQSRWIVEPAEGSVSPSVALRKMWIQTWLSGRIRQERAVFRFTSETEQLRVKLPASPRSGGVLAAVNGQTVEVALRPPYTVLVPLPAPSRGREIVLELWYAIDNSSEAVGWARPRLKPPVLEAASMPQRLYWQVCLPGEEYLIVPPMDYASEMQWRGGSWPAWLRPARSQEQLEAWIGASRQDPLPRGVNDYLFSSLGSTPELEFRFAGRRLILAFGAGAALLLGLGLMHVRALRRPEALLAVVVVLAALALAQPEAALLTAQAAGVGLVVALAAAFWSWMTAGRETWAVAPASHAPLPTEPRSTEARELRVERLSGLTTATVPVASSAAEPSP